VTPIYIDGVRFRSIKDAAIELGLKYYGIRKAVVLGTCYRGHVISYDPPPPKLKQERAPHENLMPNARTYP
jgi:hypothetical protein